MKVGHSHLDKVEIPEDISIRLVSPTKIVLSGANFQKVSQLASQIRAVRPPEPYNGKGIFVDEETVILKEGKKSNK